VFVFVLVFYFCLNLFQSRGCGSCTFAACWPALVDFASSGLFHLRSYVMQ